MFEEIRTCSTDCISEDAIQQQTMTHVHNAYPNMRYRIFAIPNGGLRNKREASKFLGMGVKAGVWDVCFLRKNSSPIWIEFKAKTKKLSPEQVKFMADNDDCDFYLVDGIDVAVALFEKLIKKYE